MEPCDIIRRDYVWIFEEVPKEIKLLIISFLDLKTVNACTLVSRQFYKYAQDNQIWQRLSEQHWWNVPHVSNTVNAFLESQPKNTLSWKEYFVEKYLLSKETPDVTFSTSLFPACINARYRHSCAALVKPRNSTSKTSQIVILGGTGPSSDVTFGDVFLLNIDQSPLKGVFSGFLGLVQKLSASPGDRESKPLWSGSLNLSSCELAVKVFPLSQWQGKPNDYKSTRNFTCCIGNKVWVWGGSHSFPPVKSNDLYALDIDTQKWTTVLPLRGEAPSPRSDHCGAVVGKEFFVFGGSDANVKPLADVHKFNTETLQWTEIVPRGAGPSPRSGHTCAALGTKIFVYGGATWDSKARVWKDKSNDIYVFDTVTNTWTRPAVTGDLPAVSTFAASFTVGTHFWLIGGGSKQSDFVSNSIYLLDTVSMTWKKLVTKGLENFQAKDCISATVAGDKVYLFGGFRGEPVNELQCIDMNWISKLKSALGTVC